MWKVHTYAYKMEGDTDDVIGRDVYLGEKIVLFKSKMQTQNSL